MDTPATDSPVPRRHRTSGWSVALWVSGIAVMALIVVIQVRAIRDFDRHASYLRQSDHLQRQLSEVHLWFEEAISDDENIDLVRQVSAPLQSMINEVGDRLSELEAHPEDQALLDPVVRKLLHQLQDFRRELQGRLEDRESGRTGSAKDERFDATHRAILASCEKMNEIVLGQMNHDRALLWQINLLVIGLVAVLFTAVSVLHASHRRALVQRNRELEVRVEERTYDLRLANQELSRSRDEASAANEAKGRFLATMSHEVRTPLQAILGTCSLLEQRLATGERDRHYDAESLRTIRSAGEDLLDLLDATLEYSRGEFGQLSRKEEPFQLARLVTELIDLFGAAAQEKGLALRYPPETAARLPRWVQGDRLRVRQILTNLLSNAIRFTQRGSIELEVDVESEADGAGDEVTVTFSITDTGPGIPEAIRRRIFEPFTQGDTSISREHGGSGLGLAICRQLTQLLGGEIWLDRDVTIGSRFHVRLPFRRAKEAPTDRATHHDPPARLDGKVLIVDDQAVNRRLVAEMLRTLGIECESVADGDAAVAAVGRFGPDVVLLDCHLPKEDGFQVTARLRALPEPARSVKIIALSAHIPGGTERALEAGMDDTLEKPVRLEELADRLAYWLSPTTDGRHRAEPRDVQSDGQVESAETRESTNDWLTNRPALFAELIETYRVETPPALDRLRAASVDQDHPTVRAISHRLRSGAAHLGATELAASLAEVETRAHTEPDAELDPWIDRARQEFARWEARCRDGHDSDDEDGRRGDSS